MADVPILPGEIDLEKAGVVDVLFLPTAPERNASTEDFITATLPSPACPRCRGNMTQRNSARGTFWGCGDYPRCNGTLPFGGALTATTPAPANSGPVVGTRQQETFWGEVENNNGHLVLLARAGCGKTFSIVEAGRRALAKNPSLRVAFTSFNSHITKELKAKAPREVAVQSLHALGFAAVQKAATGAVELDKEGTKVGQIVSDVYLTRWNARPDLHTQSILRKLVSLCKGYLWTGTPDEVDALCERHDVDVEPAKKELEKQMMGDPPSGKSRGEWEGQLVQQYRERVYQSVPLVLQKCAGMLSWIDFDDQIWLPVVRSLPVQEFDLLFVDESQDMNPCQQALAFRACPKGRIVVVGDNRQAIYAFRGADAKSMETMTRRLEERGQGVTTLPLTQTRRCPRKVVELAAQIVPDFEAMAEAPEGEVLEVDKDEVATMALDGDMVLCRTNAPLVGMAHSLIRAGKRPDLRGRDLSKKIRELVKRMDDGNEVPMPLEVPALSKAITGYRNAETYRLTLADKAATFITAMQDECDTVLTLLEGCESRGAFEARIEAIFNSRDKGAGGVILTTVHGAKGSEAERVFILHPCLMPHPNAKKPSDVEQELNCKYVALTRAKKTLVFADDAAMVGAVAKMRGDTPTPEPPQNQPDPEEDDVFPGDDEENIEREERRDADDFVAAFGISILDAEAKFLLQTPRAKEVEVEHELDPFADDWAQDEVMCVRVAEGATWRDKVRALLAHAAKLTPFDEDEAQDAITSARERL